ncbi:hypothetical protein GCM10017786_42480 [Amycolatopsis deserti]|uniref:Uncharacterized protein n=1 Tax=Amycolatopsis deserti TaxID=185696 RepID=A0ABQ3J852_9PSEU|nr:hypothetical protein [Amycolatopsis deserti]GHF04184.1 hypothetical protein GCM10017786_42480 [Amycolatopsis deserti]
MPDLTPELARHLDEAVLRPKLAKYIDASGLRSARHEVDGTQLVLIYVPPAEQGWCTFRAPGEYEDSNGKKQYVFRVGDVFVRHGTSSERWTDDDVTRLFDQVVDRRKEAWRREIAHELAEQTRLTATVQGLQELPAAAMTWRIDGDSFEQLVTELLRSNDDISLRTLLTQTTRDAATLISNGSRGELGQLLDRVAALAALSIHHQRHAWWQLAVDALQRIYELGVDEHGNARGAESARLWLDVITRVYALGALAVRLKDWAVVRSLAERRPQGAPFDYFGSWLRHALTMASRAYLFETEDRAGLLARAHNVVRGVAALRPDRAADDPAILTSLAQFDVYGAFVVIGTRGGADSQNFYTNFARYYTQRSAPAFVTMVDDPEVRRVLFDGDDRLLAHAIAELDRMAQKEGFEYDGWSGIREPSVAGFVQRNLDAT